MKSCFGLLFKRKNLVKTLQDKDILILQCNIILIHMESTKQSITLSDFQLTTYHMSDQSRSFGEKSVL